jgi:hypothetical protein
VYTDYHEPGTPEAFEYLSENGPSSDRQTLLTEKGWSVNQYKIAQIAHREDRVLRRIPRYVAFDEELAWVVGLYLAEGSGTTKQVSFGLHKEETLYISRLNSFFHERFGCCAGLIAERSAKGIQVIFSSVIAAEFFETLCSGLATTKRIHAIFRSAEDPIAAALIAGLLAGDGCYHEDGKSNKVTLCSASRQLIEDTRQLLLSVQILAGLSYTPPNEYMICGRSGRSSGAYHLGVYGDSYRRLLAWLAKEPLPEVNDSKIGVFCNGYAWYRIQQVAQVETDEVIGFQMEKSAVSVKLEDDTETHGTFCLWGAVSANSNYIPIMPLPIGQETIGGDGRNLLLTQEMQLWSEQILNGMMVPKEFVMGGLSYAGTNVSMRMMENMFIGYILYHKHLLHFIMQRVASFLDWPMARGRFKPFKMADDLQRLALMFQCNQAQKISDTTLLGQMDLSQIEENKIIVSETASRIEATEKQQLAMAEVQGKAQMVMMKYQTKAQVASQQEMASAVPAPGEPGGPDALQGGTPGGQGVAEGGDGAPAQVQQQASQGQASSSVPAAAQSPLNAGQNMQQTGPQVDLQSWAMAQAQMMSKLPQDQQEMALQNLQSVQPELAGLVRQLLNQMGGGAQEAQTDMRPLPDKLPPRRAAQIV